MKRNYECLYIISDEINEEKRNELIAKFSKMASADARIEKWGMKKFSTPINKRKEGFYVLMNFEAEPEVPNKMASLMNITDGIVRQMFVCKDEHIKAQSKKVATKGKAQNE